MIKQGVMATAAFDILNGPIIIEPKYSIFLIKSRALVKK